MNRPASQPRPDAPPVSRRALLRAAATGLAAASVASVAPLAPLGCGRGSAAGDLVELRFWNGFTGPDGRTILRLVQEFNRQADGVRVTLQRMPWATYYNKLFVAGLDGRAPELFVLQSQWVARMQGAGLTRPTDDLFDDGGGSIPAGDFNANILAAVTRDGRRWAVPLDVHPMGLYYNKALFRQAGIVDGRGEARPPTNRAEFLDAGRRLAALRTGDGGKVWGFAFTWLRTNVFTAMRQFGSPVVDADGTPAPLTDGPSVAALEFMHDLIEQGIATPIEANAGIIGFRQGKVGMIFEGIYMLPELQRQTDLDYGAARRRRWARRRRRGPARTVCACAATWRAGSWRRRSGSSSSCRTTA